MQAFWPEVVDESECNRIDAKANLDQLIGGVLKE